MRKSSFLAIALSLMSAVLLLAPPQFAMAGGGGDVKLLNPGIDLKDKESLQRGAKLFIDYCLSCHSASFMRYNRMAVDIGLTDDQVKKDMMFTTDKIGDVMKVAMSPEDAARWFGTLPPDLSVVSRSRGVDWLYSYLLGFYEDPNPSRPFGVNNVVFPEVGMPHVLVELQGVQKKREAHVPAGEHSEGSHGPREIDELLELARPGSMSVDEYRNTAKDLTAFLAYMGEPAKVQRQELGVWVLVFLAVFFLVTFALKKEYWKDVH